MLGTLANSEYFATAFNCPKVTHGGPVIHLSRAWWRQERIRRGISRDRFHHILSYASLLHWPQTSRIVIVVEERQADFRPKFYCLVFHAILISTKRVLRQHF